MSPPNGVSKTGSAGSERSLTPRQERVVYLALDQFLVDSANSTDPLHLIKKWKEDRGYRLGHSQISELIENVTRFINRDSSMTAQKLEAALKKWYEDSKFKEDPLNAVVLANTRRVLAQFQTPDNTEPAQQVVAMLPPVAAPPQPVEAPPAAPPAAAKSAPPPVVNDPKKNLAIGLELHNDTVPLAILDFAGLPVSALASERSYFTLKPSVEFPMGDWVGMVRLRGGTFQARGIPGENNEPGSGYRLGVDWGLVNPYSPDHERAGMGFEATGVAGHAGQASDLEAPGPVVRLRFWRQSDWNFPIGSNFELGFNSFLNNQEAYIPLANDTQLPVSGGGTGSPLATTSSLFARAPLHWFNVSGRYYINGRPDRDTAADKSKPFRPGEGGPTVNNLWTGQVINLNRRQEIPVFSNTQVLMGTFWPLGMESSLQQFDTISTGLVLFSLQDGYNMAQNARLRGEIWRRDDSWVMRGLMLGGDALYLGYNIIRAARAEADPPTNQTVEEFQNNPGSVTDFGGRAARLNLMLTPLEYGLSVLDASGVAGNVYDEDRSKYFITSGVAAGVGLVGFLFSGSLTGNGCAEDGPGGNPVLLRCSFPAQRDKYFKTGINATPNNMKSIENQYVLSSTMAGLSSWGVTRLLAPLSLSYSKPSEKSADQPAKNTAMIQAPHLGLVLGPNGGQLTFGGNF